MFLYDAIKTLNFLSFEGECWAMCFQRRSHYRGQAAFDLWSVLSSSVGRLTYQLCA